MKNIRILPDNIINLVAAGEVVERPSSVVKELIENSIDAHSTKIEIEIKNGGKKLICVKDNGDGIPRCDIKTAFLRHATSKIYNEEDLEKILTLGFRGEALSSICSVSKVQIFTSFAGESSGTKCEIEGGKEISLSDCASFKGTSIFVRDLFYNTPARIKFLKKDITEGHFIGSLVDHLALSHPEIAFKFIKDGKLIFQTPGDGKISSAISRIFGIDFFRSMLELEYSWNNVKVKGFISNPLVSSSSSKIQNFFVNGRWVKDKVISNAIEFSLKDEYQNNKVSSVVYLTLPAEAVDVNVHPNKTEVRFENEKIIFDVIYNAIKNCIRNKKNSDFTSIKSSISPITRKNIYDKSEISCINKEMPSIRERTINVFNDLKKKSILGDEVVVPKVTALDDKKNVDYMGSSIELNKTSNEQVILDRPVNKFANLAIDSYLNDEFKILGEVFSCFIIVQYRDQIIFIDKHAAHERLIFEKISKSDYKKNVQMLISPIVIDLSKEEYDCLIENINLVNDIGYYLEDFGYGKVLVRGVPMYITSQSAKYSILEIANFLLKNKSCVRIDDLRKVYSQIACKSSIKAGIVSSHAEIECLVKRLIKSGVSNCPHGRPIYFTVTKNQVYKKFLRK